MQLPISSPDFVENEVRTKNLILGWCEGFEKPKKAFRSRLQRIIQRKLYSFL